MARDVDHNDRRIVERDVRRGVAAHERTIDNVRRELESAMQSLDSFQGDKPDEADQGAISDRVVDLIGAYNSLRQLERWLPEVWGWTCGYAWGSNDSYSVFSAHVSRETAEAWLELYWRPEHPDSNWEVSFRKCDVDDFLRGRP